MAKVLRLGQENLLTMLEAFVYDPLLSWRLLDVQEQDSNNSNSKTHYRDHQRYQRGYVNGEGDPSSAALSDSGDRDRNVTGNHYLNADLRANPQALRIIHRVQVCHARNCIALLIYGAIIPFYHI